MLNRGSRHTNRGAMVCVAILLLLLCLCSLSGAVGLECTKEKIDYYIYEPIELCWTPGLADVEASVSVYLVDGLMRYQIITDAIYGDGCVDIVPTRSALRAGSDDTYGLEIEVDGLPPAGCGQDGRFLAITCATELAGTKEPDGSVALIRPGDIEVTWSWPFEVPAGINLKIEALYDSSVTQTFLTTLGGNGSTTFTSSMELPPSIQGTKFRVSFDDTTDFHKDSNCESDQFDILPMEYQVVYPHINQRLTYYVQFRFQIDQGSVTDSFNVACDLMTNSSGQVERVSRVFLSKPSYPPDGAMFMDPYALLYSAQYVPPGNYFFKLYPVGLSASTTIEMTVDVPVEINGPELDPVVVLPLGWRRGDVRDLQWRPGVRQCANQYFGDDFSCMDEWYNATGDYDGCQGYQCCDCMNCVESAVGDNPSSFDVHALGCDGSSMFTVALGVSSQFDASAESNFTQKLAVTIPLTSSYDFMLSSLGLMFSVVTNYAYASLSGVYSQNLECITVLPPIYEVSVDPEAEVYPGAIVVVNITGIPASPTPSLTGMSTVVNLLSSGGSVLGQTQLFTATEGFLDFAIPEGVNISPFIKFQVSSKIVTDMTGISDPVYPNYGEIDISVGSDPIPVGSSAHVNWTCSDSFADAFTVTVTFCETQVVHYTGNVGDREVDMVLFDYDYAYGGKSVKLEIQHRDIPELKGESTCIPLSGPVFEISLPSSNSVWVRGRNYTVEWVPPAGLPATAVGISARTAPGGAFLPLAQAEQLMSSDLAYQGPLLEYTATQVSDTAVVRVATSSPSISGESRMFCIVDPIVEVTKPLAGQDVAMGSRVSVQWTKAGWCEGCTSKVEFSCATCFPMCLPVTLASDVEDAWGNVTVTIPYQGLAAGFSCSLSLVSQSHSASAAVSNLELLYPSSVVNVSSTPSGYWFKGVDVGLRYTPFCRDDGCKSSLYLICSNQPSPYCNYRFAQGVQDNKEEESYLRIDDWFVTPDTCHILVRSETIGGATATSENFTITTKTSNVTLSPQPGRCLEAGSSVTLMWNAYCLEPVTELCTTSLSLNCSDSTTLVLYAGLDDKIPTKSFAVPMSVAGKECAVCIESDVALDSNVCTSFYDVCQIYDWTVNVTDFAAAGEWPRGSAQTVRWTNATSFADSKDYRIEIIDEDGAVHEAANETYLGYDGTYHTALVGISVYFPMCNSSSGVNASCYRLRVFVTGTTVETSSAPFQVVGHMSVLGLQPATESVFLGGVETVSWSPVVYGVSRLSLSVLPGMQCSGPRHIVVETSVDQTHGAYQWTPDVPIPLSCPFQLLVTDPDYAHDVGAYTIVSDVINMYLPVLSVEVNSSSVVWGSSLGIALGIDPVYETDFALYSLRAHELFEETYRITNITSSQAQNLHVWDVPFDHNTGVYKICAKAWNFDRWQKCSGYVTVGASSYTVTTSSPGGTSVEAPATIDVRWSHVGAWETRAGSTVRVAVTSVPGEQPSSFPMVLVPESSATAKVSVPFCVKGEYLGEVSLTEYAAARGASDSFFITPPGIAVVGPVEGFSVVQGGTIQVAWRVEPWWPVAPGRGSSSGVVCLYSGNTGLRWFRKHITPVPRQSPYVYNFSAEIPATLTGSVFASVLFEDYPFVNGSSSLFEVRRGTLLVLEPVAGKEVEPGSLLTIRASLANVTGASSFRVSLRDVDAKDVVDYGLYPNSSIANFSIAVPTGSASAGSYRICLSNNDYQIEGCSEAFLVISQAVKDACASFSSDLETCLSTQKDRGLLCGWCESTGSCMVGSAESSVPASACPSFFWHYDSPCFAPNDCGSCVAQSACAWCEASRNCTSLSGAHCSAEALVASADKCPSRTLPVAVARTTQVVVVTQAFAVAATAPFSAATLSSGGGVAVVAGGGGSGVAATVSTAVGEVVAVAGALQFADLLGRLEAELPDFAQTFLGSFGFSYMNMPFMGLKVDASPQMGSFPTAMGAGISAAAEPSGESTATQLLQVCVWAVSIIVLACGLDVSVNSIWARHKQRKARRAANLSVQLAAVKNPLYAKGTEPHGNKAEMVAFPVTPAKEKSDRLDSTDARRELIARRLAETQNRGLLGRTVYRILDAGVRYLIIVLSVAFYGFVIASTGRLAEGLNRPQYGSWAWFTFLLSLVLLIGIGVAMPVFLGFRLLRLSRQRRLGDPGVLRTYGLLYTRYTKDNFMFQVFVFARITLIAVITSCVSSPFVAKMALCLLILSWFAVVLRWRHPFAKRSKALLEGFVLACEMISLAVLFFMGPSSSLTELAKQKAGFSTESFARRNMNELGWLVIFTEASAILAKGTVEFWQALTAVRAKWAKKRRREQIAAEFKNQAFKVPNGGSSQV